MKIDRLHEFSLLMMVLSISLPLLFYEIDSPFFWHHNWNENHFSTEARNFLLYQDWLHVRMENGMLDPIQVPLVVYLIGALFYVFGVSEFVARSPMILLHILTAIVVYLTGKELYNLKIGIISALVFSFIPMSIYFGSRVQLETPMLFFYSMAILFFIKWTKNSNKKYFYFSAIFSSLAISSKYSAIFIITPLLIFMFYKIRAPLNVKLKSCAVYISISFLPFLLWSLIIVPISYGTESFYLMQVYGIRFHTDLQRTIDTPWGSFTVPFLDALNNEFAITMWNYFYRQFSTFGIIGIICFFPLVISKKVTDTEQVLIYSLIGGILYLLFYPKVSLGHDYHLLYILLPLSLFSAKSIIYISENLPKNRNFQTSFLLTIIFSSVIISSHSFFSCYYNNKELNGYHAGKLIKKLSSNDEKIIGGFPIISFYSGSKYSEEWWRILTDYPNERDFSSFIKENNFSVITEFTFLNLSHRYPVSWTIVESNYVPIAEYGSFKIWIREDKFKEIATEETVNVFEIKEIVNLEGTVPDYIILPFALEHKWNASEVEWIRFYNNLSIPSAIYLIETNISIYPKTEEPHIELYIVDERNFYHLVYWGSLRKFKRSFALPYSARRVELVISTFNSTKSDCKNYKIEIREVKLFWINMSTLFEGTVEYVPQRWFYIGCAISLTTFSACTAHLTLTHPKTKHTLQKLKQKLKTKKKSRGAYPP